jgi:hypothetical protein
MRGGARPPVLRDELLVSYSLAPERWPRAAVEANFMGKVMTKLKC